MIIIFTRAKFTNTSFNNLRSDISFSKTIMLRFIDLYSSTLFGTLLYSEQYFSKNNLENTSDPFASPIELEIVL